MKLQFQLSCTLSATPTSALSCSFMSERKRHTSSAWCRKQNALQHILQAHDGYIAGASEPSTFVPHNSSSQLVLLLLCTKGSPQRCSAATAHPHLMTPVNAVSASTPLKRSVTCRCSVGSLHIAVHQDSQAKTSLFAWSLVFAVRCCCSCCC